MSLDQNKLKLVSGITAIAIAVVFFSYKGFKYLYYKKRAMDSVNINNLAKKHCKSLLKVKKGISKRLDKHKNVKESTKHKIKLNKLYKSIINSNTNPEEKIDKIKSYHNNISIIKNFKKADVQESFEITKIFTENILEIEGILLQVEQYDTRIELGEFLVKYSFDSEIIQKSYIDLIGWTYMMKGLVNPGKDAINIGIKHALNDIDNNYSEELTKKSLYNICRAYRHLGSSKYTLERNPLEAIDHNNKGMNYFEKLDEKNYSFDEYKGMEIGLKYGNLAAYYFHFKNKTTKFKAKKEDFIIFYNNLEIIDECIEISSNFKNNHRLIKLNLIKTKYIELIIDYNLRFEEHLKFDINLINLNSQFDRLLTDTNNLFKGNIFIDESLEEYLSRKNKQLLYQYSYLMKEK